MPTRKAHARWEGTIKVRPQALAGTEITLEAKLAAK